MSQDPLIFGESRNRPVGSKFEMVRQYYIIVYYILMHSQKFHTPPSRSTPDASHVRKHTKPAQLQCLWSGPLGMRVLASVS